MRRSLFTYIDVHTCGNPVRLVVNGGPELAGSSMSDISRHLINEFDWIRMHMNFK